MPVIHLYLDPDSMGSVSQDGMPNTSSALPTMGSLYEVHFKTVIVDSSTGSSSCSASGPLVSPSLFQSLPAFW
jgi:hypothetical protein